MVESRPQPPTRVFWSSNDANDDADAACQFHTVDGLMFHFPHAMQQLYRCWSLWRHQTHPILIFPKETIPENAFLQGFVSTLQQRIHLIQTRRGSGLHPKVPNNFINASEVVSGPEIPYYAFERADDAKALRQVFSPNDDDSSIDSNNNCPKVPRISILNRRRAREWLYAEENHRSIILQYQDNAMLLLNQTTTTISIRHQVFDDDTSFQQQIDFFHQTDILISPHGGQLTGIPFMPDCGAVVELFAQYYLPHFFGSLATASHLSHGYIAMESSSSDPIQAMIDVEARHAIRNCPLSPPKQLVEDAIRTMIGQWQSCCRRNQETSHS